MCCFYRSSTSRSGLQARFSPLASYAAQLLDSKTIRVAEPSEGMGSFEAAGGNCGHTAYHRDDSYFPIRADEIENAESNGIAVVRFWIPLEEIPRDRHRMEFVAGASVYGSSLPDCRAQLMGPSKCSRLRAES